jgi:uncharacterized protein (TIRG00374 family)
MATSLSKKAASHGMRIFIALTLLGFLIIFLFTGSRETIEALRNFRPIYFVIAVLLIGVDFISGATRIFIFIRKICRLGDRKSFLVSFKANLANVFLAAATPFQTGGGVAQIYVLNRAGVSVSGATSVSILNFVATLGFLLIAGLLSIRMMAKTFVENNISLQFILGFSSVLFYIVTALFIVFLFKPMIAGRIVEWILRKTGGIWKHRQNTFDTLSEKVHGFILSYQSHMVHFVKNERMTLVHNIWLTAVLYFNKCLMAFVVLKGMGLDPDFAQVVIIQVLLIFFIYFCPTPGASFFAETSSAALMSLIIPGHLTSVFSILWRFFTTYFGVIVGGFILMRTLSSPSVKEAEPSRSVIEDPRFHAPGE